MWICYSYNLKKLFGNNGTGFMAMDSRTKGFVLEHNDFSNLFSGYIFKTSKMKVIFGRPSSFHSDLYWLK